MTVLVLYYLQRSNTVFSRMNKRIRPEIEYQVHCAILAPSRPGVLEHEQSTECTLKHC